MITLCHNPITAFLTVSQYKPDSFFQTPYFAQDNFTNIAVNISGGFASQAYNQQGQKVPYLQQFGTETFLKQFTDQSLPHDNTEKFGQGFLDGQFHVREMIVSCYKNMNKGYFLESAIVIQDVSINHIDIAYTPDTMLTESRLEYLEQLQQKLPENINQSGMFTTAVYAGYTKSFVNFTHLDFIDLTIKTGFMSPQAMTKNYDSFLQMPYYGNLNFGYPIIATGSLGLLDWITVGMNGSIVPWQTTTKTIPLKNTISENTLLGMQPGLATIARGPLFVASLYFQADHFHQGTSAMIGYSYTKSYPYTITPFDIMNFPHQTNSSSQLTDDWSFGSLYMQFDVDFATHCKPNSPLLTFYCNIPIAGHFCPKTTIFGSAYNLQISYKF
jgi:hypothetical protein